MSTRVRYSIYFFRCTVDPTGTTLFASYFQFLSWAYSKCSIFKRFLLDLFNVSRSTKQWNENLRKEGSSDNNRLQIKIRSVKRVSVASIVPATYYNMYSSPDTLPCCPTSWAESAAGAFALFFFGLLLCFFFDGGEGGNGRKSSTSDPKHAFHISLSVYTFRDLQSTVYHTLNQHTKDYGEE